MIEIFEGRLGGGKTYSATVRAVDHWRRGGLVCSNVEFIWPNCKSYVAERWGLELEDSQFIALTDEQIANFHQHTPSGSNEMCVLVIVDEAHLHFNARDYAKASRELLAFLTQSRKVHTDIIFISQSAKNMDSQFARLVQYVWRFRDLARWKIPGLGIRYPFQQILATQYDYDGTTLLQKEFHNKDKEVFKLYNTNSLLRKFPRLEGSIAKRSLNKAKRKKGDRMFKYVLIVAILFGAVCFYQGKAKMDDIAHPKIAEVATPVPFRTPEPVRLSSRPETRQDRERAAYDVYVESFRHFDAESHTLRTAEGWYQVGEMSGKGFVVGVSSRRVRLAQPDGRTGWVIAEERSAQDLVRTVKEAATPVPGALAVPLSTLPPAASLASASVPSAREDMTPAMGQRMAVKGVPLTTLGKLPKQTGGPR